MTLHVFTSLAFVAVLAAPNLVAAQDTMRLAAALADTSEHARLNLVAGVYGSGAWEIDGEYGPEQGPNYKLNGYFAAVAPDKYLSDDRMSLSFHKAAVAAFYLEPMAGGDVEWLGASFVCGPADKVITTKTLTVCDAVGGARSCLTCTSSSAA